METISMVVWTLCFVLFLLFLFLLVGWVCMMVILKMFYKFIKD
jgi:hypothetical protein